MKMAIAYVISGIAAFVLVSIFWGLKVILKDKHFAKLNPPKKFLKLLASFFKICLKWFNVRPYR
jgi:hypothetical protein